MGSVKVVLTWCARSEEMAQWQLWKLSLEIQEGMKGKIKFQTWWENKSLNKNTNLELKKKKKVLLYGMLLEWQTFTRALPEETH